LGQESDDEVEVGEEDVEDDGFVVL